MPEPLTPPLPDWVPRPAARYLAHIEGGLSIRCLAKQAGCHASTVLRQVQRIESRRDDPLIDAALKALGRAHFSKPRGRRGPGDDKETANMTPSASAAAARHNAPSDSSIDQPQFDAEARRILRRLCESGATLAVAENVDKAVVVRADGNKLAVVDAALAQALALKDWITCANPARISRYTITAAGRAALHRLMAEAGPNDAGGFAEQHRVWGEREMPDPETGRASRHRYNLAESPLLLLARRRDRDGKPFLSDEMVRAGERLREDFELAQMGPRVAQNWDRFLTGGGRGGFAPDSAIGTGPAGARDRVARALADLGPGLSDVALRCCCYLEGLEAAEKRMGWSARSGKIVLRIALQRLHRHYEAPHAPRQMMG